MSVTLETPLTELLDIRLPILLAPMDLVAGGALAAAVSQAGGLGLIGGGYGDANWIDQEFRASGNQRVGIGPGGLLRAHGIAVMPGRDARGMRVTVRPTGLLRTERISAAQFE